MASGLYLILGMANKRLMDMESLYEAIIIVGGVLLIYVGITVGLLCLFFAFIDKEGL